MREGQIENGAYLAENCFRFNHYTSNANNNIQTNKINPIDELIVNDSSLCVSF